jgi:CRISP-associated protein Cas1
MIKRIVDVSKPSYLSLKNRQLLIDQDGKTVGKIPVEDLGVLILEHPAITITQGVILECQKNNVALIFCDERHLPYSTLLPLCEGNQLHSKVLRQQIKISQPSKKRLWKNIVKEKIRQQSLTLKNLGKPHQELLSLSLKVKSGDSTNLEAQAARKYWPLLMGRGFIRDVEAEGANALLNYGYSIVRAMIARALVGTGLHPALGLFHHNQYNGLALADDLMEPFRPWVDRIVYEVLKNNMLAKVDKVNKQTLLELMGRQVLWENKKLPFLVVSHLLAAKLKEAHHNPKLDLNWPEWIDS